MEELRSIAIGTAGLSVALLIAAALTLGRRPVGWDTRTRDALVRLLVVAIAVQGIHFGEELLTGFQRSFPALLGLVPWSIAFFVSFNVAWLALWVLSAFGLKAGYRPVFFPIWFLALAMLANGIAHPLLGVATGGYFPGLYTSPAVGIVGIFLMSRLLRVTASGRREATG